MTGLRSWLEANPSAKGWPEYLNLPALETELAKGNDADPAVIGTVLKQLGSGVAGLELAPFARLRDALGQWSEELVIAQSPGLREAAIASESNFHPLTEADVAKAKAELQAVVAKLDQYLGRLSKENGAGWKDYFHWKDLQAQLESDAPDGDILKSVEQRFTADHDFLEMPVFANVGTAIDRYVNTLSARNENLQTQFVARLQNLAEKLKQFQDAECHSEEIAGELGTDLGWLESMRQVPGLVRSIRGQNSIPNVYIEVSGRLVAVGVDQNLDEVGPITDNILGTSISGTGHTVGRVVVQLLPNSEKAMLETKLVAKAHTRTVGYNGPATINANGTTDIVGSKRIVLDENGFASYPAKASASTKTQITGISAGGNIAQRVATGRVYENKPEAEQIAGSHAAARARRRVDAQSGEMLSKAHRNYLRKFRNPLVRRREFPALLKFSTTQDALFVKALQANRNQIGAAHEPPTTVTQHDLAAQMHESAVNNLAAALLSGVTLKEKELQDTVIEWRGELPEQLKSDEDRDPWSITFAKSRPVTIKFADNAMQITVRGQRYTSGEREFRSMNVTANYKVQPSGDSFKLVREGDLQIVPPGFVSGQTRLSTQQVTLKTLLQRKFGKLFEPEIKSETLTLSGKWEKAGPLDLKQMQASGGWLVVAWLQGTTPPAAPTDKVAQ